MAIKLRSVIKATLWFVVVLTCAQVDAQFFTKSSKSIPRMGRRSDGSQPSIEQLRHALIDRLIDDYGPSLIENLERVPRDQQAKEGQAGGGNAEIYYDNNQPMAWRSAAAAEASGNENPAPSFLSQLQRNERIPPTKQRSTQDASIALRALNANRYIQYLASGQPPMSFDKVLSMQQERNKPAKYFE